MVEGLQCAVTNDLWPNAGTMLTNATFKAEADAEYAANKTGRQFISL